MKFALAKALYTQRPVNPHPGRIDLQLFAEDEPEEGEKEEEPKGTGEEPDKKKDTYTSEEVDKIVQARLARANAEKDKEIKAAREEAAKLARMNKEEKAKYDMEKLQRESSEKDARIAQLEQEAAMARMSKEATNILRENHGIEASQDMLDFVVSSDAKTTKENIDRLVRIIEADRKSVEVARARGTTPKDYGGHNEKPDPFQSVINKYRKKR